MKSFLRILLMALLLVLLCATAVTQEACPALDAADEAHHSLIFRNSAVRVLEVQLGRLDSTDTHCHQYTYLTVATSESHTVDGPISTDWMPGDARLIYGPVKSILRNDQSMTYRAVEVETLRTVPTSWVAQRANSDPFGADLGTVKPTWSVSFTKAGLTGTRAQLASGDSLDVSPPDHLLIAITSLELEKAGSDAGRISLQPGETLMLPGGSATKLTNADRYGAKFVLVEF